MSVLQTFTALIRRDMAVYWPTYKDRAINAVVWGTLCISVFEYIMPQMGLASHGVFIAASVAASWGFFEVTENVSKFVADLEGNRSISYYLTLPIPQWMIFLRQAVTNALQAFFIALLFLPMGKILLWNSFSFAQFSFFKFLIIFPLIHLFYGSFSLLLATHIESLEKIGNVWIRIVYPLWWLGCFQFSWTTLYAISPKIAYINLLNPLVYVMEGARYAILGQEGSLPFWNCVGMLFIFTVVIFFVGVHGLKKRLDCV
jgi:ABC-type polysaccharide/polyol phosphate export permease